MYLPSPPLISGSPRWCGREEEEEEDDCATWLKPLGSAVPISLHGIKARESSRWDAAVPPENGAMVRKRKSRKKWEKEGEEQEHRRPRWLPEKSQKGTSRVKKEHLAQLKSLPPYFLLCPAPHPPCWNDAICWNNAAQAAWLQSAAAAERQLFPCWFSCTAEVPYNRWSCRKKEEWAHKGGGGRGWGWGAVRVGIQPEIARIITPCAKFWKLNAMH